MPPDRFTGGTRLTGPVELSVIIPTLNRRPYLERCLQSVLADIDQGRVAAEIVVIDGGSTDGTVELLQRLNDRIGYWVSEKDSGVSEAARKGVEASVGEVLHLFAADDESYPGTSCRVLDYLRARPDVDAVLTRWVYRFELPDGSCRDLVIGQPPPGRLARAYIVDTAGSTTPPPEATFYRRRVFERFGHYDLRYHYLAYLEYWLRLTGRGARVDVIEDLTTRKSYTAVSDTAAGDPRRIDAELRQVLRRHGGLRGRLVLGYRDVFGPIALPRRALRLVARAAKGGRL